jgi:hypothetical protein
LRNNLQNVGLAIAVGLTLLGMGCDEPANQREARAVDDQQALYVQNQPAPVFNYSLPRHLMVELYKAKNQNLATYSYVISPYTGKVIWYSPSLGYPIPGGTQLTNSQARDSSTSTVVLPQAEPDGLYTPSTSEGTYVMCVDSDGMVTPAYVEDHVLCSVVPLKINNGVLMPDDGVKGSLRIDPSKH